MAAMQRVTLAGAVDLDGFRATARRLLRQGIAPDDVAWAVAGASEGDLLAADEAPAGDAAAPGLVGTAAADPTPQPAPSAAQALRVPAEFLELCREVIQHAEPTRFHRLYRLLWRLQHQPALRHDALDPELAEARRMAQAVRREQHKMKAFVRFREVREAGAPPDAPPLHVAWFEPAHHVVEAVAPFFMRRFAGMRFAILTPERSVQWDGHVLTLGPGAGRQQAPQADAGEALWLTYYASIFNPARLKLRAMEKEMPRRYWTNLPEAVLISTLATSAQERSMRMVEQAPTVTRRRLPSVQAGHLPPGAPVMAGASEPGPREPAAADSLPALQQQAAGCRNCPLGALATQTVFGEGPPNAALMLVGEQPGDQEDLQGRPFVGPAGQLLAKAMAQLGWPRDGVYITNAVKHFKYTPQITPRGKRRIHKTPAQREADACLPWLEREIGLVAPQAIVALGGTAARQLLGRPVAVLRERGQWFTRDDDVPVLVTLHPSALLRMELDAEARDAAFNDWVADLERASRYARQPGTGAAV
jgi:DNA polymerase